MMRPFRPTPGSTIKIIAAGSSSLGLAQGSAGAQVRVRNTGSVDAYVEFGPATVAATVPVTGTPGSMGIAAGAVEVFTLQGSETNVSVTSASGTPNVEITTGWGE